MIVIEISIAVVVGVFLIAAGCWRYYEAATSTSPHLEAATSLFVFAVLGSLIGTQLLVFVFSAPATAITMLNLGKEWDQSVLVRWAALMQRYGAMKQIGVSLVEIQSMLLLGLVAFLGLRLIHHVVVIARVMKVARRNQLQMLRKETGNHQ